jgi:hypothetical protein
MWWYVEGCGHRVTFGSGTFGGGSTLPALGAVTLEKLEQETARRLGPYFLAYQATGSPTSSTSTSAIMPTLQSTALIGGPENLWLLRRGHVQGGADIVVQAADRQRLILSFDSAAGRVVVDHNWNVPMAPGEIAELHHLDPAQELRMAVIAGLRRCFFEDRYGLGGFMYEADLTAALPWLIDPRQVLNLQTGWPYSAVRDVPFSVFSECGHVWIRAGGGYYGGLRVTVLHNHAVWINGTDALQGPTSDLDELSVDLDYAAAAAHIEAWRMFPSRMFYAAAGNLQATQEMAAKEFTRQAFIWNPPLQGSVAFKEVVSLAL